MFKTLVLGVVKAMSLIGCASVPMETQEASDQVKQFQPPSKGMAGLNRPGICSRACKIHTTPLKASALGS